MHRYTLAIALTFAFITPVGSDAATITYSSQAAFDLAIGSSVLDTYSAAGYFNGDVSNGATSDIHTNASMSAVLGETDYTSTQYANHNTVHAQTVDSSYCAGCNGTFRLTFTSTSVGNASGVYGVGFNFGNQGSPQYYATVTFGDGSIIDYALPISLVFQPTKPAFFGITSDLLINNIHFGLPNGGTTNAGLFAIDNLEIGQPSGAASVPEPVSLMLVGTGLLALVGHRRSRRASGVAGRS